MSLDMMLERFVFLVDGALACDLHAPHIALPFHHFVAATASSLTKVPNPTETHPDQTRMVATARLWLQDHSLRKFITRTFDPATGMFTRNPKGVDAVNLWLGWPQHVLPSNWQTLVKPFIDHMAYLLPNKLELAWCMGWLAHMVQRPGELPHAHAVMVAKQAQGVGRNWLAGLLARVMRGYVALNFPLIRVLDGGFNGSLAGKILATVDELHEGGSAQWKHAEALKSELTTEERTINPKYGREYTERNVCRFLMFSNHAAALPLEAQDRRLAILENPTTPKPQEYYSSLYALRDSPQFIGSVFHFLRTYDLGDFAAGSRPPKTAMRAEMIDASEDDATAELRSIVTGHPSDCIEGSELRRRLDMANSDDQVRTTSSGSEFPTNPVNNYIFRRMLGAAGVRKCKAKVVTYTGGKQLKIYALRNTATWLNATPEALRAEIQRGR